MRTPKYSKVDYFHANRDDLKVIKEFLQDERDGVEYHKSYNDLMNIVDIMTENMGVRVEMANNCWYIRHKYHEEHETFMWHNYNTRCVALYTAIVRFLKWWNLPDREIINKHYKWLREQESKSNIIKTFS
jgi:hypothetical protein